MSRAELGAEVRRSRESLTASLTKLEPAQWEAESLCDGWRVRDVVGHLVHIGRLYRAPVVGLGFVRAGFRLNRYLRDHARRWSSGRSVAELLAALQDARYEDRWVFRRHPQPAMALGEFVIHGQDIRRPLGIAHSLTTDQLIPVAEVMARPAVMAAMRYPWGAPQPPTVRLESTDAPWTAGDGPLVRGPLEAIVMSLAGRRSALHDLSGDGVALMERT